MDLLDFKNTYWNYYLQLEKDFFETAPYCSIAENNNKSFSVRYLQLHLSICSEIDTICKSLCENLDGAFDKSKSGIDDYIEKLSTEYPTFVDETVSLVGYKYPAIQPWKGIDKINENTKKRYVPSWWGVYNDVKHRRDQIKNNKANYECANQKNIIHALSALYVLIQYFAAKTFVTDRTATYNNSMSQLQSKALNLKKWTFYSCFGGQGPSFSPQKFSEYMENGGVKNEL